MNSIIDWLATPPPTPNEHYRETAESRQATLTKPPGSLGKLEEIAIRLASLQDTEHPRVDMVQITLFVGDHGVAAEGVSAFPQAVTTEMVKNFAHGGAAASVLARELNAHLEVINLGTANHPGSLPKVFDCSLGPGTANFCHGPAMTETQLERALAIGKNTIERAVENGIQLFVGGEMGIANSTAATALACALLDLGPAELTGPGSGLDENGVSRKREAIRRALKHHAAHLDRPLETLRRLGGFEIAALTGSYVACAQKGLPALVDGFISSVAALVATHLCPGTKQWLFFSHLSAEPGHRRILDALDEQPLLDLEMRLGEGSGAAVAVPLLQLACALHNEMATFAEAGVPEKTG